MKKIASLVFMAGLIFLLGMAAQVKAYTPPLQPSASSGGSSVTVSAWDPMRQTTKQGTYGYVPGVTVVNLKQDNGLMAWVVQSGSTYFVTCCTYDPHLGNFVTTSIGVGIFSNVDHFNVKDGVISWVANQYVNVVTYDPEVPLLHPEKSAWQKDSYYSPNMVSILTADGIVAWIIDVGSAYYYAAGFCGYHPGFKAWIESNDTVFDIDFFAIIQATVYVGFQTFGLLNAGVWFPGETQTLAYFLAQPTTGKAPLWVWFTDLSITPTSINLWQWDFGDGAVDSKTGSKSSSYHTYTKGGVFTAKLNIYDGAPLPQTTIKVYPSSLPFLPLLLNNGKN
jgi:PKD repeat protein